MEPIPAEVLKKVKLLELSTRRLVNNIFAGEYKTAFKGQGMTFADFREYVPGDDVRAISWTLTAKAGKPFIKKFEEERELSMFLLVDASSSLDFGSKYGVKGETLTHLAALLAFSAIKNKDQVGMLMFTDRVEHFVPLGKGQGHVRRILRDLYFVKPKGKGTSIEIATQYLQGLLKKKSVVFILSDFLDQNFDIGLRSLAKKHDVTAMVIEDPLEQQFPEMGLVDIEDPETGDVITVDSSSSEFQQAYRRARALRISERDKFLKKSQVDNVQIINTENFVDSVIKYFKNRPRR